RPHFLQDRLRHRGWFDLRLDDEAERPEDARDVVAEHAIAGLEPGRVDLRDDFTIERTLLHVTDHTDNPHPPAVLRVVPPRDTLTHRVVTAPEKASHRFIDHDGRLRAAVVLWRKDAAAPQRDAEGVEVLADDEFVRNGVREVARRLAFVLDCERAAFADAERQVGRGAGGRDG